MIPCEYDSCFLLSQKLVSIQFIIFHEITNHFCIKILIKIKHKLSQVE